MCLVHLWGGYLLSSRLTDVLQGFAVAHFVRYKGLTGRAMVFANLQVLSGVAVAGMCGCYTKFHLQQPQPCFCRTAVIGVPLLSS